MMVDLPAGMRNNNPGNIKYVGQRNALGPSVNTDQGDPQAVYDSPETGMTAAFDLALRKYNAGKKSAADLIAGKGGWTPGHTAAANNIARTAGLTAYDDLNLNDPVAARKFMRGLVRQEHGNASNAYTDDLIDTAYSKVKGGVQTVANKKEDIDVDSLVNDLGIPAKAEAKSNSPEAKKLREDAAYYDKTNPEAAKQFRVKADALDAKVTPAANSGEIDVDSLASEFGAPAQKVTTPKAEVVQAPVVTPTKEGDLTVNNAVRAAARGVPLVGGVLNKMNAATNALIAPVGNQFFPADQQLKGDTFAERYANSLAQQEGTDATFKAQNPLTNTALEVGGAIGATLPVAATAAGARALGVTGETLLGRAGASALSGAGVNAADTLIRSGDANQAGRAGLLGGVVGGAVPLVGAGAGELARKGMELASPVTTRVANRLSNAFGLTGPEGAEQAAAALRNNPRLALMDADQNAAHLAQGLAVLPGDAQSILTNAVSNRAKEAAGAVKGVFDESLGAQPNVPVLLEGMKNTAKTNAKKGFGEALKDAKPVDLEGFSNNEIKTISAAWDRVLKSFPDPSQVRFSQPEAMHLVQQQLRREADALSNSAAGSERLAGTDVGNLRKKLIEKIDEAAGGKFKPAQKQFADDMAVQEAFDKGTTILKGGNNLENRPDYWAEAFKQMTPAEKESVRLGARTAVDNFIGQSKNAASQGSRVLDSEFNFDKLKIILGSKEAKRLQQLLKDEVNIAANNAKITGGSQTEIRRKLGDSLAPREVAPIGSGIITPAGIVGLMGAQAVGPLGLAAAGVPLVASVARKGLQSIGRRNDIAANTELARILSTSGDEGANMIKQLGDRLASQNRLSSAVGAGANVTTRSGIPTLNQANEREPLMITVRKKFTGGAQ